MEENKLFWGKLHFNALNYTPDYTLHSINFLNACFAPQGQVYFL